MNRRSGLVGHARRKSRHFIRYSPLDALFSKYVRLRDRCCQRCGRAGGRLEAAHMFGRGQRSVRYDPENCYAMCGGLSPNSCHRWLDTHTTEKMAWLKARIGEERYHALQLRASLPAKMDPVLTKLALEARMKELATVAEEEEARSLRR